MSDPRLWPVIVRAGLLAGALDITFACLYWALRAGVPAERIFQSVAAGLLGESSFSGGWATAALGLGLHFAIVLAMAAAWCLAARRWPALLRHPWRGGVLYGLFLYGLMQFVVVPLSAAPGGSQDPLWITLSVLAHVVLVGLPIALLAGRFLRLP